MFSIGATELVIIAVMASVPLVLVFLLVRSLRQSAKGGREATQNDHRNRIQEAKTGEPKVVSDNSGEEIL